MTGCTNELKDIQSIGGGTIEDTLNKYSEAWANIDFSKYTGKEILPYMTKEGGKKWFQVKRNQYVDAYKKLKTIREFTETKISDIQNNGDTATAVLVVNSIQKEPDIKVCVDVPVKVTQAHH